MYILKVLKFYGNSGNKKVQMNLVSRNHILLNNCIDNFIIYILYYKIIICKIIHIYLPYIIEKKTGCYVIYYMFLIIQKSIEFKILKHLT